MRLGKEVPAADSEKVMLWPDHHLSHTHAVLWTVILVATVGNPSDDDWAPVGLQEGDAVASTMLAEFGLASSW